MKRAQIVICSFVFVLISCADPLVNPDKGSDRQIIAVQSVSVDKSEISMVYTSAAEKLTAKIVPAFATNAVVTWSVEDPSIATVTADPTNPNKADVKALQSGTTRLLATTVNGGKVAATTLTVGLEKVTSVTGMTGAGQSVLYWTSPANPYIDHFEVSTFSETGYNPPPYNTVAGASKAKISSLTNNTTYTFSIRSVASNGTKSDPVEIVKTTMASGDSVPPGPVNSIILDPQYSGDKMRVYWKEPADADLQGILIHATSSTTGASIPSDFTVTPDSLASKRGVALVSVTPGASYTFTLTVIDTSVNQSDDVLASATATSTWPKYRFMSPYNRWDGGYGEWRNFYMINTNSTEGANAWQAHNVATGSHGDYNWSGRAAQHTNCDVWVQNPALSDPWAAGQFSYENAREPGKYLHIDPVSTVTRPVGSYGQWYQWNWNAEKATVANHMAWVDDPASFAVNTWNYFGFAKVSALNSDASMVSFTLLAAPTRYLKINEGAYHVWASTVTDTKYGSWQLQPQ